MESFCWGGWHSMHIPDQSGSICNVQTTVRNGMHLAPTIMGSHLYSCSGHWSSIGAASLSSIQHAWFGQSGRGSGECSGNLAEWTHHSTTVHGLVYYTEREKQPLLIVVGSFFDLINSCF